LSRFRVFALLAALVALASALAACGGGGDSSDDPQQVIENATLKGIESGDLEVSLDVTATGEDGGDLTISLSGPFQGQGTEDLPLLDLTAEVNGTADGEDVDFEGGLTLLSDRAFVGYEGDEYEVDPTTFGFLKSGFEQAQQQGSKEGGDVTACQEAATGLEIDDFVDDLTSESGEDVDGTSTTKVSGELNADRALDTIVDLLETPACAAQLEAAGPLPLDELDEARGELTSALKKAHIDVYVGEDDIIRRVAAEVTVEPKDSGDRVEVDLDMTLSGVNEDQEISPPSDSEPLERLFKQLGVNPLELLESGSSGDIGGLLEGLLEGKDGGSGSGGGSASGGSGGGQQDYLKCLQEVETAADLQRCASLAP
jgi:hypothetical protein